MALIDGRLIDDALAVRRRLRWVEGGKKHARPKSGGRRPPPPAVWRAARAPGCRVTAFRSFSPFLVGEGFVARPLISELN